MDIEKMVETKRTYEEWSKRVSLLAFQAEARQEPHLPNGTPTRTVPCRFCGCLGANHLRGGACIGPIEETPVSVALPAPFPSQIIQCPRKCQAYCPPGGIEILS